MSHAAERASTPVANDIRAMKNIAVSKPAKTLCFEIPGHPFAHAG